MVNEQTVANRHSLLFHSELASALFRNWGSLGESGRWRQRSRIPSDFPARSLTICRIASVYAGLMSEQFSCGNYSLLHSLKQGTVNGE
jgi:hypothetical protein